MKLDIDRWITPDRIRGYSIICIFAYVVAAIVWLVVMGRNDWIDPYGKPLGYDFLTFYAASDMARMGDPAGAFDVDKIFAAEIAAAPANKTVFLWHYPPVFQLLITPLAYMPYGVALASWLAVTLALYLLLVREISDHPWALLVGAAFPAVFVNLMHGQNGFLNTALLGFGLLWLDRRPWLAGVCIGLLVYKPHFGVLLPLLLAVQGRWKTFASAAVTAVAFCAAAYAAYGIDPWMAFFKNFKVVSQVLEAGFLPWSKIPSVFIMLADVGVPLNIAYAAHFAVAAALAVATVIAWRMPGPQRLKVALAVPAIIAVSPYCFDYDLVLLALPIGLLADYGRGAPLPAGARTVMALAFFAPMLPPLAERTHLQLMPIAVLLLYAVVWRTLAKARGELAAAAPMAEAKAAAA